MGFFFGFFLGIGAGVVFSEYGFNYPFNYEPRPDGFGKVNIDLEVLNPAYNTYNQVRNYFIAAKNKAMPARQSPEAHLIAEDVAEII